MKRRGIERMLVCFLLLTAIFAGGTLTAAAQSLKIWGYVYNDINKNRLFDPADPGISNWTMFLKGFNGVQATPLRTTTNDTGYYSFDNVTAGMYMLWEAEPNFCPDWVPESPTLAVISVSSTSIRKDFGNIKLNLNLVQSNCRRA